MKILYHFGNDDQKQRWLAPLVAGDVRSFFSMTEPEVSGADPTHLRTTAVLDGDEWVVNGHKWFSSGAEGAAFGIVMAVTEPDAPPRRRMSQIIVPADAAGVDIEPVPVLGHRGRGWSTHCEVRYRDVRVPEQNVLGQRGDGFRIAQMRLGPGRIHHVMRWLGQMERAFEPMCKRALEREAFGGPLADKQTVQNWIADSAAEIEACRLMTYHAANKIDEGEDARVDISLIKFYAASALSNVIDRAVQVHGGLGLTDRSPLSHMYTMARGAHIYDGPDEVHRMVVSRRILKTFAEGGRWSCYERCDASDVTPAMRIEPALHRSPRPSPLAPRPSPLAPRPRPRPSAPRPLGHAPRVEGRTSRRPRSFPGAKRLFGDD